MDPSAGAAALCGALVLAIMLAVSGCAGDLASPERFLAGSTSTTCASGLDVEQDVFAARCATSGCHGVDRPSAGLDLASPGVADRLVGVASSGCGGRPLIDPESPGSGVLLEKLTVPSCGARMPLLDEPLSADEISCVRAWVSDAAGGAPSPDAGIASTRDAAAETTGGGAP